MYPILFSIGPANIYSHGFMISLGAIVAGLIIASFTKKTIRDWETILLLVIFCLLGGMVGARLLYLALYSNQFANFKEMLALWNGGMVSFGGMAGGLIAAVVVLTKRKESIGKWFDFSIIGLTAGWAIGRIGCFLNGDSVGIVTLSKWGIWGRFQTALFESLLLALISLISFKLYQKNKNIWPTGTIFVLSIGLYGFGRFFIDFVQEEPYWFWHLKYGQVGSLLTIVFALILFWIIMVRAGKENYAGKNR